jgi:hypothetical protein
MNINFPENLFPAPPDKSGIYKYKVNQGKAIAQNKSIIFCGIVRNVAETLQKNILRIHKTASLFKDYHIFIYENDSDDCTKQILINNRSSKLVFDSEYRQDKNYRENLDNGVDTWHFKRCEILAECRNKYLSYIRSLSTTYDYVCVIDLDIKGGWSYDGFFHGIYTLEQDTNNSCVSSYGVLSEFTNNSYLEEIDPKDYLMYDSLAFRPISMKGMVHMLRVPMFNRLHFNRGDEPIQVRSNFGGMAIYKTQEIINRSYEAKHINGSTNPDHVCLNQSIIEDGKNILLDPSMIVSYSHHQYSKENND